LSAVSRGDLIRMMVGRTLREFFPKEANATTQELLRVEHLELAGGGGRRPVHDLSFTLHAGEIVGLAGLMGAGRTEVLETIFGVHPRHLVRGRVFLTTRPLHVHSPRTAIRRGLAFITEDRKGQSLITMQSVRFNVSLAALGRYARGLLINQPRERAAVQEYIRDLRIKTPSQATVVNTLSGGNQQKVALAKCLLTQPRIVLMDEPTRGIDVGAKVEIYSLINRLAARGIGILMVSSELPELLAMCDRIVVLCEGRLTGEFSRDQATQEKILEAATARREVLAHAG